MIKRIASFLLVISCAFVLCSCASSRQPEIPVNYYYAMRQIEYGCETGVVAAEAREAKGHTQDYTYLLAQYLKGPRDDKYISPFPAGTSLESFEIYNNIAHITLSMHLSLLTGAELTVACVCITKTVTEMTGINSVQISAQNGLLDGESYVEMTNNSFVFSDIGTPS